MTVRSHTLLNTESLELVHAVVKNRSRPYITIQIAADFSVASVLKEIRKIGIIDF